MQRVTIAQVEHIAFSITRELFSFNEPIPDFATRFPNILESCLETPFQTYGKKDLYYTDFSKAGILFYLMNKNHPFQNGNKRIAVTTLCYVFHREGKWIKVDAQTLYRFAVWVAESPAEAKEHVLKYIEQFLRKYVVPLVKQ
jgi:prophage maintenance system killer protein